MKRFGVYAGVVIGIAASLNAVAQEKKLAKAEVPAPVLAAFAKAYPKAQAIGYSQEKENGKTFYEIESKEGPIRRDVTFLADGKLEVVEEEIAVKDLPETARATFDKEKGKLTLAEKITRGATTEYEGHFKEGKKEYEVVTDATGKILKREPSSKD